MHDIFYFTDVHGIYELYRAVMDYCNEQDSEATIIFGGDACDRGPDGYKIMNELLDNSYVIYLKGNHEDMFVKAARFIKQDYNEAITKENIHAYLYSLQVRDFYGFAVQDCLYNGGYSTIEAWMLDGMPEKFVDKIATLPLTFSYNNLDFCHAGSSYKIFKAVADAEYENDFPDKEDAEDVIWDRNYLGFGWAPNRIAVFGHTPVFYLASKYYGKDKSYANAHPCKYYGNIDERLTGEKIDMDVGSNTNGKIYVLNCLTMKAQGFKDLDFENDEKENHVIEKIETIQM